MTLTDYSCTVAPWPEADNMWSFINPSNAQKITSGELPDGRNFAFYLMGNGLVVPSESWAFDRDVPLSGAALGTKSWIFKEFKKKKVPLTWLRMPCMNSTIVESVKHPLWK